MFFKSKFILIIFIFMSVILYADFPEFQVMSEAETAFMNQQSMIVNGENIYFTFWTENAIKLAISEDSGETFDFVTVTENVEKNQPIISQDSANSIYIFFQQNKIMKKAITNDNGDTFTIVPFLYKPGKFNFILNQDESLKICYSERFSNKLSRYQHFTNIEASENAEGDPMSDAGIAKFCGSDIIEGKTHSNSNIFIQNTGEGDNGGWPTFQNMVTTAGEVLVYPNMTLVDAGTAEQVFLGGYQTYVSEITYSPTADEIRANGNMPIPSDVDLVHCLINGSTGSTQTGYIQAAEMEELTVYSWFPDRVELANGVIAEGGNWFIDADSLWTNYITIYDTIWSPGPSISLVNNSAFIDCKLWIEGEISGRQTYGCSDTIYVSGDITYANTQPGNPPDDDNPNITDYFGLVSEQKILIAYKHRNFEGVIHDDNTDGIMLYGSYAALAQADENVYTEQEASHQDGIFTFQYHHRHGSTPNFWGISPNTGVDTLYEYVDLQKWIFPPNVFALDENIQGFELGSNPPAPGFSSSGFPYEDPDYLDSYPNNGPDYVYPYGTDYPWYNPVWPESQETMNWYQEGETTITLFGSIAQTRRGYTRRSGSDDFNHPIGLNEWDLEEYHFGGDHAPTGYDKDFHYDSRLKYDSPPDFPTIASEFGRLYLAYDGEDGIEHNELYIGMSNVQNGLVLEHQDQTYLLLQRRRQQFYQTKIYSFNHNDIDFDIISDSSWQDIFGYITSMKKVGDTFYFVEKLTDEFGEVVFNLLSWQPENEIENLLVMSPETKFAKVVSIDDNPVLISLDEDNQLNISYNFADNQFNSEYCWQTPWENQIAEFDIEVYANEIHFFVQEVNAGPTYYLKGNWLEITPNTAEDIVPQIAYQLSNYPNPFNPTTTISFQAKDAEDITIEIFNIRGQKVRQLSKKNEKFKMNEIVWNGKDESGKSVSSGTYIYNLKADNKIIQTNKMVLIK